MSATEKKPTPRQLELMRLLKERQLAGKSPPTGYEMLAASLSADFNALKPMLRKLRQLGFVDWQANGIGFRSLKLTRAGMAVAP